MQLLSLQAATPLLVLPLGTGHARSIVSGHIRSMHTLFVGTSDGSVVFCALPAGEASAESSAAGSPVQARRAHAGSSGVALHWVPPRDGAPAHVYAQSDRGLILREIAGAGDAGER